MFINIPMMGTLSNSVDRMQNVALLHGCLDDIPMTEIQCILKNSNLLTQTILTSICQERVPEPAGPRFKVCVDQDQL